MKEWQFDVLFFVGVLGAVAMLFGPEIGLDIGKNPTTVTGVGAILAYVLAQRKNVTKSPTQETETIEEKQEKQEDGDGVQ